LAAPCEFFLQLPAEKEGLCQVFRDERRNKTIRISLGSSEGSRTSVTPRGKGKPCQTEAENEGTQATA